MMPRIADYVKTLLEQMLKDLDMREEVLENALVVTTKQLAVLYIYVCVYVCIYLYVLYVYTYIYIYICIQVCVYIYIHIYL